MLLAAFVGASVFFILRYEGIVELVKEYRQFRYEESLPIEERMRIRGML